MSISTDDPKDTILAGSADNNVKKMRVELGGVNRIELEVIIDKVHDQVRICAINPVKKNQERAPSLHDSSS